ncbi:MAG TPA: class I adenylate-forming enzyme family protein [Pseudomonadales bacterium]|nr:class I adenylate-forming enzyme family protein [Pseudomonadales bacterium]
MDRQQAIAELTAPGGPFETRKATVLGVPMTIFANAAPSLRAVFESTRAFGDREFLVYEDERWTFAELHRRARALAHYLVDHGVRKGDRVAIGMRNYPEWVLAFWACQSIGAVAVTLNAWWTGDELNYAFEDSGARAAILDGERVERIVPYLPKLSVEVLVGVRDAAGSLHARWLDDALTPYLERDAMPDVDVQPDDYSTIMYTSGTTGRPKGALATHRNHVTNLTNSFLGGAVAARVAGVVPQPGVAPPQPVSLQTFPFFHIGGLSGLYVNTATGAKVALMYKWNAEQALELVQRERVSSIAGVPTVVRQLLEAAKEKNLELSSLAGIASGGAPVPPDLIDTIGVQFSKRVAPGNGYGLTETTSAVISNGGADYFARPDSVGRPAPVADARVVDDRGIDVADGEIGEIWIRGPHVVQGYWNKPEATAEAFTDGWFHTGDLGYRDPSGFFYVVDRKKDVVIRGGENVYCAEVEAVLFQHPAVQDVAIIGLPHRMLGEEVAAVIEARAGQEIDPADIQAFVATRLARFKAPTQVLVHDGPLPRTATGKVLKRDLKQKYSAG